MLRTAAALSLATLFTNLLSGCFGCEDKETKTFQTTKQHHDDVAAGKVMKPMYPGEQPPQESVSATLPPTTTESGVTTGDTTGTTGDTGDDTTGGDDTTTGVMLSESEICDILCAERFSDVVSCSLGELQPSGFIEVQCTILPFCGGRHHLCVASRHHANTPTASAWLARAAHDEAASVHAFNSLLAELTAHRAPEALLTRLREAAADEVRHAAHLTDLARHHHATPLPLAVTISPPRDLLAIAVENAREGCVNETWAALCAAHQARHASDPRTRAIFTEIAADEARHAELAWSLDTWLMGQLTPAGRALVETTRRAAVRDLLSSLDQPFGPELAALGLPDPATAAHLAAGLDASLWSLAA